MTIIPDRLVPDITLKSGSHEAADDEMCVMEYVAWITGEPWSDHPQCVDPVIASFMRGWNDGLPTDEARTRLLTPLATLVIGTRTTGAAQDRRAFMATDWAVRTYAPAWLRLAGLTDHADALAALPELVDVATCDAARRGPVAAAGAAARAAAGAAARAAACLLYTSDAADE